MCPSPGVISTGNTHDLPSLRHRRDACNWQSTKKRCIFFLEHMSCNYQSRSALWMTKTGGEGQRTRTTKDEQEKYNVRCVNHVNFYRIFQTQVKDVILSNNLICYSLKTELQAAKTSRLWFSDRVPIANTSLLLSYFHIRFSFVLKSSQ